VRARRGFGEDSKEQYKFYLNLRVYSSCRVQDVKRRKEHRKLVTKYLGVLAADAWAQAHAGFNRV